MRQRSAVLAALIGVSVSACLPGAPAGPPPPPLAVAPPVAPPPAPAALRPLIGEYERAGDTLIVREQEGALELLRRDDVAHMEPLGRDSFRVGRGGVVVFERGGDFARGLRRDGRAYERVITGAEGGSFRITPLHPVAELRRVALAASPPPREPGTRAPELVDVARLDRTLRLDIRYATSNNFMGTAFYEEPRALLQRPAAEALVRANRRLRPYGYGIVIHDAYRPWHVTKMFWDATPSRQRSFVANPANGSRHNRGSAVDIGLYDLDTGRAVDMPSLYDEFTHRAAPDYPGGTALQRWRRELLRAAMEAEGFTVFHNEWWHFDHRDWSRYPVLNLRFEEIRP